MKILKYVATIFLVVLILASVALLYNCTNIDSSQGGRIEEDLSQKDGGSISDSETENIPESDDSTELDNSTTPSDPADPEDSTAPSDPADPGDSTAPSDPADPEDSTEPDKPTEPTKPTDPEEPKKELTNPAPNFTVLDYNGNQVKLSDYIGKPIVLNFWATWCGYCKMEMPDFERARQENPDVIFLMVNATDGVYETVGSAKKYIEDNGYGFEVVFDTMEQAQSAYHITGFPTTYFIDEVGNLVVYARGAISYNRLMQNLLLIKG